MKTSNPYGANDTFKVPPDTIQAERSKNGGKGKARYPDKPLMPDVSTGQKSGMKIKALTPGGPTGS
jgi:hypothetical protein